MKKYIKQNSILNTIEDKIRVVSSLPQSGANDEIIIVKYDGFYQYKNNTWNKVLGFATSSGGSPIGELKAVRFPSEVDTSEWLYCDGSTFDASLYPELYSHLGSNTLPDLRGMTLVGVNTNTTDNITSHDIYSLGNKKPASVQNHGHNLNTNCHYHIICSCSVKSRISPFCNCFANELCGEHRHGTNCWVYCDCSPANYPYCSTGSTQRRWTICCDNTAYSSTASSGLGSSSQPWWNDPSSCTNGDFVINGVCNPISLTENSSVSEWDIFNQFRVRYYIKAK